MAIAQALKIVMGSLYLVLEALGDILKLFNRGQDCSLNSKINVITVCRQLVGLSIQDLD